MAMETPRQRYREWLDGGHRENMFPVEDGAPAGAAVTEALQLIACALTEIAQLGENLTRLAATAVAEHQGDHPPTSIWRLAAEAAGEVITNPDLIAERPGIVATYDATIDGEPDVVHLTIETKEIPT